jgi:hypothetical protein
MTYSNVQSLTSPCFDMNELERRNATNGGRLIVGNQFAAILPKTKGYTNLAGRAQKNTIAQIRRAIREQQR